MKHVRPPLKKPLTGSRRPFGTEGQPRPPTDVGVSEGKERFEDYLAQVEKIVAGLEEGNLSLEESLGKYETGIKALKKCYEILEGMEKRIEMLVKDEKGELRAKPFKPRKE